MKQVKSFYKYICQYFSLFFFAFWNVQMIAKGFAIDSSNKFYQIILLTLLFLVFITIPHQKWNKSKILIVVILLLFSLLVYVFSHNYNFIIISAIMISIKYIDINSFFKFSFIFRGLSYLINFFIRVIGLLPLGLYIYEDRIRYTFGYSHPNLTHGEYFTIVSYYLFYKKGNLTYKEYILILILDYIVYLFTDSRTGFLLVILLLLLNIVLKYVVKLKIINSIIKNIYYFIGIGTVLLSIFYRSLPFLSSFGNFSSRFLTANILIDLSHLNLFGQEFIYGTDLGYVNLLFNYGIISFLFYLIGHSLILKHSINKSKYYLVSYLLIQSIYFILESYGISVLYDLTWIYYSFLLPDNPSQLFNKLQLKIDSFKGRWMHEKI